MERLARGAGNVFGRVSGRVSDLVKILGGVVVLGGGGGLYGCGAMTSAVGVQQGRSELVALGEGLTQLEAAERGRSDVSQTVNVRQGDQDNHDLSNPDLYKEYFFVANKKDGEGRRESDKFKSNEPICFVGRMNHPSALRNNCILIISDSNGKTYFREMVYISGPGIIFYQSFKPGELQSGEYLARWEEAGFGTFLGKVKVIVEP